MTRTIVAALALILAAAGGARGQEPPPPVALKPPTPGVATPFRVNVVVARYQGEKRISSLPYTLFIATRDRGVAQVRMGAEIPVSAATKAAEGANAPAAATMYERLGTEIDCVVRVAQDGRYLVELTISDRSIYADEGAARPALQSLTASATPPLRSFRAHNAFLLRDGESTQFTAAADRITGETVRIELSLQALK